MTAGGRRPSDEELASRFREIATADFAELPVYDAIARACAASPVAVSLLGLAKPGQARPVLLFAAVHYLLLGGLDHPLADWYPSVSGRPPRDGDPGPAFLDVCERHHDELAELVATRSTQTNEVNRSVVLAAALRVVTARHPDMPLALVELGPSAGLNLHADRYAVDAGDGRLHGHPDSPVRLVTELRGLGRPDLDRPLPPVVDRAGLDLSPIDVEDGDAVRWLRACLWPEQVDRFRRFEAALAVTRADRPRLVAGDLVDDLPGLLATLPPGTHAVVFHSWVLTYVARDRRPLLADALAAAAKERTLSWVTYEGQRVAPFVPPSAGPGEIHPTILGCTTWEPERSTVVLAHGHPHASWLRWEAG